MNIDTNTNTSTGESTIGRAESVDAVELRADRRHESGATVWTIDEDLTRLTEVGRVIDLSFSGARIELHRDAVDGPDAWRPGDERLVFLDDSSGADPFARHRPALVRVVWSRRGERVEIGVEFITRRVGWTMNPRDGQAKRTHARASEPNDATLDAILERIVVDATRSDADASRKG